MLYKFYFTVLKRTRLLNYFILSLFLGFLTQCYHRNSLSFQFPLYVYFSAISLIINERDTPKAFPPVKYSS